MLQPRRGPFPNALPRRSPTKSGAATNGWMMIFGGSTRAMSRKVGTGGGARRDQRFSDVRLKSDVRWIMCWTGESYQKNVP